MQINKINFYKPITNLQLNPLCKKQNLFFCGLKQDKFEVQRKIRPFGADKKNAAVSAYDMKYIDDDIKEAAKKSVDTGIMLKKSLDDRYGKDNYVFVSIGTSPVGVAKTLDIMGQDVRYVPISGLRHINKDINSCDIKSAIHPSYQKYLDSIGLNKKDIEKDRKHYVVCDYVRSGITKKIIETYLKSILGLPKEKIDFENLEALLNSKAVSDCSTEEIAKTEKYINDYCYYSGLEDFCGVPHLEYKDLNKADKLLKTQKTPKEKDFETAISYYIDLKQHTPEKIPFGVNKINLYEVQNPVFSNLKIKFMDRETKKAAHASVVTGLKTKEMLDNLYGKDGYVFVSIGTSPAGVAKTLEYEGVDVRYLPISNLRFLDGIKNVSKDAINLYIDSKYDKFLDDIGLTKEKIEEDKRHYVFCDYTKNGATLKIIESAVSDAYKVNKNKFSCISLNNNLENYMEENYSNDNDEVFEYMDKYMGESKIAKYSGIPHISYVSLQDISKAVERKKTKEENDFEFAVCYYLKKQSIIF